jgi:glucan phosphoethanolaminetransferase (alkaline phosphatase superfamily)
MLRTYGRGRAEQFRLHPTPGSALNFVPPLFCLYLVTLAVVSCLSLSNSLRLMIAAPLLIYFVATILQTLASMKSVGVVRALLAWPLLVASHIFYGLGFWRGLFTKLNSNGDKPRTEVVLENVAL